MLSDPGPLAGLRVLDLADYRGAFCARLLAELGAHVIKVEPPAGDPSRRFPPQTNAGPGPSVSLFFAHANAGKRSIALDIGTNRNQITAIAVTSDVLVVSATPSAMEAVGLDYASLARKRPDLVYVSITPFGATGPWRDRVASDLTAQAAGGMVWLNGDPTDPPLQGVGLPAYHMTGMAAAVGALLAVRARRRTGRGQFVDVSMQAVVAGCTVHATALYRDTGRLLTRRGARHWSGDFHVGPTANGDLLHTTLGDWTTLREWVQRGAAGPLDDPALATAAGRREHANRLVAVLDAWASRHTAEELATEAQLRRLAYAAVRSPAMLRHDAHLHARNFLVPVSYGCSGATIVHTGVPYRFSGSPCPPRAAAPAAPKLRDAVREDATLQRPPRSLGLTPTQIKSAPLAGIRVLDLSWLVAGPLATRVLADHGAAVIKLERPFAGDPPATVTGLAACLDRGKRSIAIDLGHAAGRMVAERLIAASDVLVENFSRRVFANWGWHDGRLAELNPRLVTLHLSAFGQTGPERDAVAFGPTLQARAGHTWLMRHINGRRAGWGFAFSDVAAGWRGALAVLAALWHRSHTGRGQAIDLSQYENLVDLLGTPALAAVNTGRNPDLIDNRSQEVPCAPHGVFRCADETRGRQPIPRWCAIAVLDDTHWQGLQAATGNRLWTRNPRLRTVSGRLAAAADLHEHLGR